MSPSSMKTEPLSEGAGGQAPSSLESSSMNTSSSSLGGGRCLVPPPVAFVGVAVMRVRGEVSLKVRVPGVRWVPTDRLRAFFVRDDMAYQPVAHSPLASDCAVESVLRGAAGSEVVDVGLQQPRRFLRRFGLAGHRVVVRSDFVFRCDGVGLLDSVGVIFVCHALCEGTYVCLCDRPWRWQARRGRAACVGFGARERGREPPFRRRGVGGVVTVVPGWARWRGLLGLLLRVRGARGRGVSFRRWRSLHRCVEPWHRRRRLLLRGHSLGGGGGP